ncbi:hypothetical protein CCACVL1_14572 [Corchorus capsularis]|uniref:RRM domain-containing protein n=1 Tax=Corchorus capsularis TaxID=210143 RepID=A0A1R3I6I1_COCAP|nr:hypothetical protein CCACVL1_14572 [Corchorus capsularis]
MRGWSNGSVGTDFQSSSDRCWPQHPSYDWRSHFFSVFVGHLSWNTSVSDLWNEFGVIGKDMDVFIPNTSRRFKSTFAFVHYKHESEMKRAIFRGDGLIIVGNRIKFHQKTRVFSHHCKPPFTFRNSDPLVIKRDIESKHAHVVGDGKALKTPSESKYRPPHVLSPEVDKDNIGGPLKVNNEVLSMFDIATVLVSVKRNVKVPSKIAISHNISRFEVSPSIESTRDSISFNSNRSLPVTDNKLIVDDSSSGDFSDPNPGDELKSCKEDDLNEAINIGNNSHQDYLEDFVGILSHERVGSPKEASPLSINEMIGGCVES